MKHLFGMAKSSLDLRGGKGRNLELDFLRLVYAVQHHQRRGEEAHGYLAVLDAALADRAAAWAKKYDAESLVTCVACRISSEEQAVLRREKAANVDGMIAGTQRDAVGSRSEAFEGRRIGERGLRRLILEAEPDVREVTDPTRMPFGIRWDFYGTVGCSASVV